MPFKRRLVVGAILLSVLGVSVWLMYQFRVKEFHHVALGDAKAIYRWGRPYLLEVDRNLDGEIDYRARMVGWSWFQPPDEVWVDEDFDGQFEKHYAGLYNATDLVIAETDIDGDGSYDTVVSGAEAEELYSEWKSRWGKQEVPPELHQD